MDISRTTKWVSELREAFPPIIWTAFEVFLQLRKETSGSSGRLPIRLAFFALVLVVAFVISQNVQFSPDFFSSVLTVLSILAGFLMSLLLFVSANEHYEELNHNELYEAVTRIRLLLKFQTVTFLIYLLCICSSLLWFIISKGIWQDIIVTIVITSLVYAMLRSFLLPAQLYEIQSFRLGEMLNKKKSEAKEKWHSEYLEHLKARNSAQRQSNIDTAIHQDGTVAPHEE